MIFGYDVGNPFENMYIKFQLDIMCIFEYTVKIVTVPP